MNKDLASDTRLENTPGHQGDNLTGGKLEKLRVLYCRNVPFAMNFEMVALMGKQFGKVERVRLKIVDDETSLDAYIIYDCHKSAEKAHVALNGHSINDKPLQTSLFDISNLKDDPFDYYPEEVTPVIPRKAPTPIWFVANYKTGHENYIKASETLNKALNGIPPNNIKRYGRNILIKAKNKIQSKLLEAYLPSTDSNISHVSPHNSFNLSKGIIYSKDLYELTEDEILRSPSTVYLVKKLKGTNHVILLHFTTEFLPDYVNFGDHVRIKVRRFKPSPKQCRNCLEYGHVKDYCLKNQRCHRCSSHHETDYECKNEPFCFLCEGKHSPNSNDCPRRKLEKEIVETADVERISIGSAKRQVMGANRNENSNYAKAISIMKSAKKHEAVGKANTANNDDQRGTRLSSAPAKPKDVSDNVGGNDKNKPRSLQSSKSMERTKSDPSINRASSSSSISEASKSGTKPKESRRLKETRTKVGGWWVVPGTKRPLQLSPDKSGIETQNRFEALDPLGPLQISQPMKKMALSSSCMNLSSREETEIPVTTPMEESPPTTAESNRDLQSDTSDSNKDYQKLPPEHQKSSRTPPESHQKSSKDRPTKLNRPSGSAKNLASLAKHGKTGSTNPKHK